MAPIRVGLIGLSTGSQGTSWASTAHLPYLLSDQGKSQYEIAALCNSSVSSAEKSIEHYKLPGSVKAYDSPEKLAQDADIDLVICVVGVEKHYELLKPAVEAGKNVYTELPLASNMQQIRELAGEAEKKGIKTMFGMQGQSSPVVTVVKKLIADGKIGKVLSTTYKGNTGLMGGDSIPEGFRYIVERKAGGNHATIFFLHSFNCLQETFGELASFNTIMGIERPHMNLIDPSQQGKVTGSIQKDTPDNILLHGKFSSGPLVNYELRSAGPFPGEPGCRWSIHGDKGEVLVTNPAAMFDITHEGVKIQVSQFGKDGAETVDLPSDELSDLKHPAQNVGRLYDAYAKGDKKGYADWKLALQRHELIEQMFQRGDGSEPFGKAFDHESAKASGAGSVQAVKGDKQALPQEITREAGGQQPQTTAQALEEEGFEGSHGAIAS